MKSQITAFQQLRPSPSQKNDPVVARLLLLWHGALQLVQKHVSILNDSSLWANNWRDSVNCSKLKVLSNYTDSHRRVKVSLPLWSNTDDEMASNYRNQTLNEGSKLQGPTHTPASVWSFEGAEEHVSLSKSNLCSEDVIMLF